MRAGHTFGGAAFLGLRLTPEVDQRLHRCHAVQEGYSKQLISHYLLETLKITNDKTDNIPAQSKILSCKHMPSEGQYKMYQNNPYLISLCLFSPLLSLIIPLNNSI